MPIDLLVVSAIVNRWVAVPLLAVMYVGWLLDQDVDRAFAGKVLYATLYAALGVAIRRMVAEQLGPVSVRAVGAAAWAAVRARGGRRPPGT